MSRARGRFDVGEAEAADRRLLAPQRAPRYPYGMKIRFTRLNHVQLTIPAGAEDEAREFYGGLLGLEEIEKPGPLKPRGGLWFRMADVQLHLGVEEPQPRTKRHPAFEVEEIDRVRDFLSARGVAVRDEVDVPGVKRFSFFDPFGNRVELMQLAGRAD